jgi:hypothetical protein
MNAGEAAARLPKRDDGPVLASSASKLPSPEQAAKIAGDIDCGL